MDSRTKAHALADLGMAVFPLGRNKRPVLGRTWDGGTQGGFYHGSSDHDRIDQMWDAAGVSAHAVGVWAGASGAVCVDVDVDAETGTNGFRSLRARDAAYSSPVSYGTPRGGEHHLFRCDDGLISLNHFAGVDIKGGRSYWVHYGPVPTAEQWAAAPEPPAWVPRGVEAPRIEVSASVDEMLAWVAEQPEGEFNRYLPYSGGHYADLNKPLARLFWNAFNAPGTIGVAAGLSRIIDRYERSPVTSIDPDERADKVLELAAWFFGIHRAEAPSPK